jgi:hypothetical protein
MAAPKGHVELSRGWNMQPGTGVDWNGGYLQLVLIAGPAAEKYQRQVLSVGRHDGNPRPSTLIDDWQRCCRVENTAGAWDSVVYMLPSDVVGSTSCEQIDVRSIMKRKTRPTHTTVT